MMSCKISDKRREYMKNLMRKRRADNKLINLPVPAIIIEPVIEPNPITFKIQIINKYKECLELQKTAENA